LEIFPNLPLFIFFLTDWGVSLKLLSIGKEPGLWTGLVKENYYVSR
jgi:hypothetical protein